MALGEQGRVEPAARLVSLGLASGLPLACYLATASGHGYWLDSGEFVAASTELGIAHPPGHPASALLGALCTLVPLGPLAFRVALASALAASASAAFLALAIERTVRALGVVSNRVAIPLALGATWLVVGSYGYWLQAVRPEVYALQALCACVVIERILALETAWPTRDVRPIYAASLAFGLGLANHHFLALLILPAVAPTLARVYRVRGLRPLALSVLFTLAGLATYVYLPIRARTTRGLDLGDPSTLDRFYWVVSAQAWQKNAVGVVQPLAERFLDVLVQIVDSFAYVPLVMALAGAYALVRTPGARRVGYVWIVVVAIFAAARAWLGFIRSNPDALGYLMPLFAALGALAAAFVAAVLASFGRADRAKPSRTAVVVALVAAALGAAQVHHTLARVSLASFAATDAFEELGRRDLPARAVLIAHDPETIFRFMGGEAEEELRPDVTLVPVPLLSYPGLADRLAEAHPELAELLRSTMLEGAVREGPLQSLAGLRPVLVELDPRVDPSIYETLVPAPLFHEALPDDAYEEDRRSGAEAKARATEHLLSWMGADASGTETRGQLLWTLYNDALYYAAVGDRDSARTAIAHARALVPEARELVALEAALSAEGDGPIDVRPFFPTAP